MKYFAFIFGFSFLIFSCKEELSSTFGTMSKTKKVVIHLQPYHDFSAEETKKVQMQLLDIYPFVQVNPSIPLPKSALNANKTRYRADSLIRFLSRKNAEGNISIGLTHHDISTTKNGIEDWGVMGLGFCPGTACVASTFRLSKSAKEDQFYKVAIHELGHTQGLPHCEEKTCFMRDAKGNNPTNEETDFCEKCKKVLIQKGWNFSKTKN